MSFEVEGLDEIVNVLRPYACADFMYQLYRIGTSNHVHELFDASASPEDGCLDLWFGEAVAHVIRPRRIQICVHRTMPWLSFIIIHADDLEPTGVYPESDWPYEEIYRSLSGEYYDAEERHSNGSLPQEARPAGDMTRWFGGAFVLLVKKHPLLVLNANLANKIVDANPELIREASERAHGELFAVASSEYSIWYRESSQLRGQMIDAVTRPGR